MEKKRSKGHLTKNIKRWLAFFMSLCLIGTMIPVSVRAESGDAESGSTQSGSAIAKNINLNAAVLRPESTWSAGGNLLYFGKYQDNPVAYRVLSTPDTQTTPVDCLLLDCDTPLEWMEFSSDSQNPQQWTSESCTVRKWLNGNDFYESSSVFSVLEKTAIAQTTLAEKDQYSVNNGHIMKDCLTTNPVFSLSGAEINELYTTGDAGRNAGSCWLRSVHPSGYGASTVTVSGSFGMASLNKQDGVNPAFNVNLSSILFASENQTDKTDALSPVHTSTATQWKLTLLDSSKTVQVTKGCNVTRMDADGSTTVTVPYNYTDSNTTNPVSQISVMITDKPYTDDSAQILYYGALEGAATKGGGTSAKGTFTLPADLTEKTDGTDYYAYMIAEDVNGEKETDYASEPVQVHIPDTMTNTVAPSKQSGTLTSDTAEISFTGKREGTYYYILKTAEEAAPESLDDFVSDTDGSWTAKEGVSTGILTADANNRIKFTGLTAGTDYILYLAAEDGIVKAAFTTLKIPKVAVAPMILGTYGQTLSEMEIKNAKVVDGENDDAIISGAWTVSAEDADVIPVVGTTKKIKLTFTPTGENADRYEFITCDVTPEVAKAAAPKITDEEKSCIYAVGTTGKAVSVDVAAKLPADRGTTTYTLATNDNEKLLSEVRVDKNGYLTYQVNQADRSKIDKKAVITVTAAMQGYENAVYTLTIRITDKKKVVLQSGSKVSVTGSNALTYGEKLSKLILGNAVFVEAGTTNVVKGTLTWSNPNQIPAVGTTQADWIFKPADSNQYAELTGSTAITVARPAAKPTTPTEKPTPKAKPVGTKLKDSKGNTYKVTNAKSKTPTVQYKAPKSSAKGTVTIPATVTIGKVTYKVTSIADNAFKNNKKIKKVVIGNNIVTIGKNAFAKCTKLTSITIGKNVKKIGKNAFTGCKKLKTITIKSKKLTKNSVSKGAFSGISKKTVVKVPKSKYKAYKKLLCTKGLNKKAKIKKN